MITKTKNTVLPLTMVRFPSYNAVERLTDTRDDPLPLRFRVAICYVIGSSAIMRISPSH